MLTSRESIKQAVDSLDESQLQQVAAFIATTVKHPPQNTASPWQAMFDSLSLFSEDFMTTRTQLAPEQRESLE